MPLHYFNGWGRTVMFQNTLVMLGGAHAKVQHLVLVAGKCIFPAADVNSRTQTQRVVKAVYNVVVLRCIASYRCNDLP
jgi:hypothetical protein